MFRVSKPDKATRFLSSPKRPLFNGYRDPFPEGQSGRGSYVTSHLHLLQSLRMSWAIQLVYLYAFMVWTGTISPFWPFVDYRLALEVRHEITVSLEMHALKWIILKFGEPIPVAARSKAWICGRSLAGTVVSNPAGGMSVCCDCCVLSVGGFCVGLLTHPEETYRMWCVWVWSWILDNEEALAHGSYCTMAT